MSEELIKLIKEKRPNISNSSLKTYESILRNLYEKVFPDGKFYNFDKFNKESEKIIKFLKDLPSNKRKTILSALVVITDNKDYRELMLDDIKEYNKEEAKQTKTKEQEENWIDKNDIEDTYQKLQRNAKHLYGSKDKTNEDLQQIQFYIILSLFGGFYIPPRRSKDYVNFKIKNIDKEKDNYIDKNELVFNSYKTAKTYGEQRVEIPKELKTILNKWIKVNPTEYLLFDSSLKPLSNVKLNQRLNKLFGKKVGVNMMRKSYLSNKYADTIDIKRDMEKTMKDMGSSTLQENIYIKKNR
jgi:integrase